MKKFFHVYGTSLFILCIPFQVIITFLTFLLLTTHGPGNVNAKAKTTTTLTNR
jgi:hypothetical protein